MAPGGEMDASVADEAANFQSGLTDLKRRGSALLVVGTVPTDLYEDASTQMLGAPSEPRRRLLVTSDAGSLDERLHPEVRRSSEWTRVIRYCSNARSASAAVAATSNPILSACERRVDGGLGRLGAEVANDIEDFDTLSQGFTPAELRVAFDCLPSLLSKYGQQEVFRFLHVMTSHVRARTGMIHVWSPGARTDEVNRTLEPLFDAVVELDVDGTEARQRWHLTDTGVSSGWFPLNADI